MRFYAPLFYWPVDTFFFYWGFYAHIPVRLLLIMGYSMHMRELELLLLFATQLDCRIVVRLLVHFCCVDGPLS